jgi:ubiquinone/menaquinone biosynthesis C-methylase UbiE
MSVTRKQQSANNDSKDSKESKANPTQPKLKKLIRDHVQENLAVILEKLKFLLPAAKNPKVLSVACGVPSEFIPLLEIYPEIDFTGLDINASENELVRDKFKQYSQQFRILT